MSEVSTLALSYADWAETTADYRCLMAANTSRSELRNTWESAAPGWAKWEQAFSAGLVAATDALIEMAGIRPGMRVLDLACGAGTQTIEAARRVGPHGSVVAVDISPTMLEHVRRNAVEADLRNIETLECAAEDLAGTLAPFDASICRLGLMLFPSPRGALKAVQSVLKPGARFAALVFTAPANNAFMARPMGILLRHAAKPLPMSGQPGIFALGGGGVLEQLMRDTGLVDVKTRVLRASLRLSDASAALEMMQQAFGAYRAVVADLSDAEKAKAWKEVHQCLKQFDKSHGFETKFEFILGSGANNPS
jgi:ubiquinone/menaquinone biosynthesis C-methylase UbiE